MLLRFLAATILLCLPADSGEIPILKVMSWNIHHGVGNDDKLDLPRIATVIRAQNPDVVVLQEVDQSTTRTGNIDQAKILADLTGFHVSFGEAMPFQGGSYGQAVLSKHPIKSIEVLRLSQLENNEPRIGISARILHPSGPVTIVGVHLDFRKIEWRLNECTTLAKSLDAITGPVVVAGDFNAVPNCPSLAPLKPTWQRVKFPKPSFTHPADKPDTEIDHMYFHDLPAPKNATIIDEAIASDHRPIVATFEFPGN